MSPTGLAILGVVVCFLWLTVIFAKYVGRAKEQRDFKAIEENPRQYLENNLGSGLIGDLYRSGRRVDDAVERATRPADDFYGIIHCPSCNTFAYHHIDRYTKRHVVRQCVNEKCKKKWKQLR